MRPTSGLTFGGRYQLSSRVAIGGMGEVWQATDLVIGRTVAIKILKDEYLGDPGFLERFRAEARHAALVNHEGIANVFDYGEEEGSAYLVMELVPGEALSTILERERVLSTDRVLDIVAQTASALHAAHSAGLVHRDIKPGNLLITPDGRVKITDFGIARIADQVPLTATGQVMGTVQYLSPEQASGHPASPTTDIYSLGIVAYEALAGRRPFTGESQVAIAMAQINESPPDLPVTVSEPVRNLVYACIAKNPADRPASAAHLARAAQALRRGDVAGAAAAVPGILGAGTLPALQRENSVTQATRVLNAPGAIATSSTPLSSEGETKGRNPWTWPLIALIGILVVVLVGTLIALIANPSKTPPTPSKSPSASPSITPTPTPTPTSNTVNVTSAALTGKTEDQVRTILDQMGLAANVVPDAAPAPSADKVGLSFFVDPTGNVQKGTTITVKLYGAVPTPTAPAAMSQPTSPTPPKASDVVALTIPTYTGCPSGSTLTGFTITSSPGSTFDPPNPAPANTVTVRFTLSSTPGPNTISYVAVCSSGTSPSSPNLTITTTG
ncbi:protein kinase domain-containing protein [Lacisediminihabitans profunda]|uniref:non-specific serine/threonine protein kinase n=1 Tax=Lacisediminihabitans profunda TaxID=2594790 RepID=A0A5C8UP77_9MICO|nr:protein kinase [Lacisediminihabitans profunda]TXN29296.1 protein kinase [Lacisediminihabitans profunda]